MVGYIENDIKAGGVRTNLLQYLGIEIFIITAPHTALCLLWHISPAIEVLEALSLCKGTYPLPGSRAGIPEIGDVA